LSNLKRNLVVATLIFISLVFYFKIKVESRPIESDFKKQKTNQQYDNFKKDLKAANSYTIYDNRAWDLAREGNYSAAIIEYKKALSIIESLPDENWADVPREEMNRINMESKASKQIFSRYGLVEALEKTGRYDEALENVEWLSKNQQIKGKEELLRIKLEKMRQNLLNKSQSIKTERYGK
jgi:tetratricopeptide (TPR) repeat protein